MPDYIRKPISPTSTDAHPIRAVLTSNGTPVSIPSGSTVNIRIKDPGTNDVKVAAAAQVVKYDAPSNDPDCGKVNYQLQPSDLQTSGIYFVDFVADIAGLGEQVFPEGGNLYLLVLD